MYIRYVYPCLHQKSFTSKSDYSYSFINLEVFREGVYVPRVKVISDFLVNSVIKPIMEALVSMIRKTITAIFQMPEELSIGHHTVTTQTGVGVTSYIDGVTVNIDVLLVGTSTIRLSVGQKSIEMDLLKVLLEIVLGAETPSPATDSIDSLVWAQGIGLNLLNAGYILQALSQKTGWMPGGPLVMMIGSVIGRVSGLIVLLFSVLIMIRERNRVTPGNLNPWTKSDLDEFDKLLLAWLSALKFILPLSFLIYETGKSLKTIFKGKNQKIERDVIEKQSTQKYTPAAKVGYTLAVFLAQVNDFYDNVINASLTPIMYSWLAVIGVSEVVTYALMDKFGKTDPQAKIGFGDKKFLSPIVLPTVLLLVTWTLKIFSSAV